MAAAAVARGEDGERRREHVECSERAGTAKAHEDPVEKIRSHVSPGERVDDNDADVGGFRWDRVVVDVTLAERRVGHAEGDDAITHQPEGERLFAWVGTATSPHGGSRA